MEQLHVYLRGERVGTLVYADISFLSLTFIEIKQFICLTYGFGKGIP